MPQNADSLPLSPESFKANFARITPLILEEWPGISPDSLQATGGDLDQVIDYIADATDRTRALIRRQLRELYQLTMLEAAQSEPLQFLEPLSQLADEPLTESELRNVINLLEKRTEQLLVQFKKEVLPEFNEKVKSNVGGSLLTALGIGFILGLLLGGSRGR